MRRVHRRAILRLAALSGLGAVLAGCGQKGPLFFREDLEKAVEERLDRDQPRDGEKEREDAARAPAPKP
ncbi:MAG: lipoprotein [Chromatiales bacterium]|nr:lipoprotein [Chromatiales bacterium]